MIALADAGDDARFAAPSQVPAPPAILAVGPAAPLAPPPPPPVALPAVRQRIRVFWTDMDEWLSATIDVLQARRAIARPLGEFLAFSKKA